MIYEHPENPVGWNTWQRHFNHHLKTVYGVDYRDAGIDTCWLHNEMYNTSERTIGSALECAYWYGNKYGLVVMNELDQSSTRPQGLTSGCPTQPGMYLMLYNLHPWLPSEVEKRGLDPEEHRFWDAAPVYFGPLKYVHTTYAAELKYSLDGPHNGFEEEGYFPVIEDLLEVDGKYYGDWSVFIVKEQS